MYMCMHACIIIKGGREPKHSSGAISAATLVPGVELIWYDTKTELIVSSALMHTPIHLHMYVHTYVLVPSS